MSAALLSQAGSEVNVFILEQGALVLWNYSYNRLRIVGFADAYDAMTCSRTYRVALDEKEALTEIHCCSGTQFDPDIVRIFSFFLSPNDYLRQEYGMSPFLCPDLYEFQNCYQCSLQAFEEFHR